jgi:hypothetical protein
MGNGEERTFMTVVNVYNATGFQMALTLNGQAAGTIPPSTDGTLRPLALPFDGSNVQAPGAFGKTSQLIATSAQTSWLYSVDIDNGDPWQSFALVVFDQGAFLGGNGCDHAIPAGFAPGSRRLGTQRQEVSKTAAAARRPAPAGRP